MRILIAFLAATLLAVPTYVAAQVQSQDLESVLLDAAAAGQTDSVGSLLDSGASIEAKNKLGATPLIFAAVEGHTNVVKLLLDRGADVNAKTSTGITPLIAAASAGEEDIVKLLLEKGADVSARDKQGRTALNMAETAGETQVAALLKSVDKSSGSVPTPVAEPTAPNHTETIRGADSPSGLTVRAEPSPQGQVIAYLPVGSKVTYEGKANNGWVRLSAPAAGGWVADSYLGSRNPEASVISVDNPEQCLRVRSGPGTNHEKIGCLPKGAKLKLAGTVQNGWVQVAEPITGWVTARQIQAPGLFPSTPAASGAQKERRKASQAAGYRRQHSESDDSDFAEVDREFDEEVNRFSRENEEAQELQQRVAPGAAPGRVLRIGPFGIGLGF